VTVARLKRRPAHEVTDSSGWTLRASLLVLGVTTAATALISEILVHSLQAFANAAGLTDFFIAMVIVAIVGNAAEHGGALVIARRGKMKLATEIAISSSAQVGLLVIPLVTLASFAFGHPLSLAFRQIELFAMGAAAIIVAFVVRDGRARRWQGALLIAVYGGFVIWFLSVPER
jgi:Ca2+:H+ antiporter